MTPQTGTARGSAIDHAKTAAVDAHSRQEVAALSSVRANVVFPGRSALYVHEVAKALAMVENQVLDLIEAGELIAYNIANSAKGDGNPRGNKTPRKYWRVPTSAYDAFILKRTNSQ